MYGPRTDFDAAVLKIQRKVCAIIIARAVCQSDGKNIVLLVSRSLYFKRSTFQVCLQTNWQADIN
jgi:hypothetical protein